MIKIKILRPIARQRLHSARLRLSLLLLSSSSSSSSSAAAAAAAAAAKDEEHPVSVKTMSDDAR